MNKNPLVTVNILSFNRKDELRNTLTKVYEQDYKNIEVIVVDNASSDGSSEMVKNEFPEVKLIQTKENIGIAGWNEGFKVAKGEYVLVLDDDSYPGKNSIVESVNELQSNSNAGCIAFNIFNCFTGTNSSSRFEGGWLPRGDSDRDWPLIVGSAFLLRKNIYELNSFSIKYFLCFHELPIINSIWDKGFNIRYKDSVKAYHYPKTSSGYNKIRDIYHFRNMINYIFWQFPKPMNALIVTRVIFFYLTRSIKYGWFTSYLFSVFNLRSNMIDFIANRISLLNAKSILETGIVDYKFTNKLKKNKS